MKAKKCERSLLLKGGKHSPLSSSDEAVVEKRNIETQVLKDGEHGMGIRTQDRQNKYLLNPAAVLLPFLTFIENFMATALLNLPTAYAFPSHSISALDSPFRLTSMLPKPLSQLNSGYNRSPPLVNSGTVFHYLHLLLPTT